MCAVVLVLGSMWVLVPLAYGFAARVLNGPMWSPLGQLVTRVLTPRMPGPGRLVPGPPKRFAQGIGATLSISALVAWGAFDAVGVAKVLVAMIAAAATLEAVFALCLGCHAFALLMRLGVVPASACEDCDNFGTRLRKAA